MDQHRDRESQFFRSVRKKRQRETEIRVNSKRKKIERDIKTKKESKTKI